MKGNNIARKPTVTKSQIKEIVETKKADLNAQNEDAACRIIEGTARSMGIEVID